MTNSVNHTQDLRSSFLLNDLIQFVEAQCIEGPLLTSRTIDSADNLFNHDFSHNSSVNFNR